ncbi:Kunitz/Bovine pancreatic trypsin inhibitor domain protein [Necator americanus]|uniref:Kunitz/Bovine pancreatic trypsin inhibitor domain protein n=1 Tax=Necator americanus TaxID=51031 RepID=W2T7V0_NECAM|nr:Kunitz/Bovine pancreatic trypsin inhibitor domain protein [Necator americanus]ETN77072.1 Kunitz/Bovine pancreatic trypsin inhibitor domain protein [Necator americanus]
MPKLERKPRANSNVCFRPPGDKGNCPGNSNHTVQRWTYTAQLKCAQFTYSGCGGSENRFATQMDCELTCKGKKPSNNPVLCSYDPDWGSCNQLRYMWFYNQTRGTCDQFLYGGCDGNPNRFETFEICQKTCELSGIDPCMEPLDRGNWCEAMSNRCEKRYPRNVALSELPPVHRVKGRKKPLPRLQTGCTFLIPLLPSARACSDSGTKPVEKTSMLRHIVLDGLNRTYYKTEPQWADYAFCLGYRYNVTGRDTVLSVHLCSDNINADCINEAYRSTNGEEFCNVLRPFLRGTQLYTWYFRLDTKEPPYIQGAPGSGRVQRDQETMAAILLLKPNHCYDVC